jgi:transcription elongation GreA/GreB family factor
MSSKPPVGAGALGSGAALMSAVAALERAEESDRAAHARLRSELASAHAARAAAEAAAADAAAVADAARQSAEQAWRERDAAVDAARALEARLEARTPLHCRPRSPALLVGPGSSTAFKRMQRMSGRND